MFYHLRNIMFVNVCDLSNDQITFHLTFMQKPRKLQAVELLFPTVNHSKHTKGIYLNRILIIFKIDIV